MHRPFHVHPVCRFRREFGSCGKKRGQVEHGVNLIFALKPLKKELVKDVADNGGAAA
ncbi:MAG: hypothetical protein H6Q32_1406 [Bacteroidetes bacterium]|nr:hypothetical protein [Bacteroidota bacterium]